MTMTMLTTTTTSPKGSLLHVLWIAVAVAVASSFMISSSSAFGLGTTAKNSPLFSRMTTTTSSLLAASTTGDTKKPYVPKWVKKDLLSETAGDTKSLGYDGVGLKGTIPVVFRQGNETKTSMAWAGQPLRDVASQAGQFITYGCGKGECGACECMMNGKWVRPCVETVPADGLDVKTGELILQLKALKSKGTSSGTFFSIKSFFMGFWNNILGMMGFFKFRGKANENWEERRSYEDLVAQKTAQKKLAKQAADKAANGGGGNAAPGMA